MQFSLLYAIIKKVFLEFVLNLDTTIIFQSAFLNFTIWQERDTAIPSRFEPKDRVGRSVGQSGKKKEKILQASFLLP